MHPLQLRKRGSSESTSEDAFARGRAPNAFFHHAFFQHSEPYRCRVLIFIFLSHNKRLDGVGLKKKLPVGFTCTPTLSFFRIKDDILSSMCYTL
jgi:hypothetical protein